MTLPSLDPHNFSNRLQAWFHQERADIPVPGRGETDPYAIWIAEVMLQQTQVSTVWPYYSNWMKSFPSVESLSHAQEDQVLKAWEGLGYYSRARNLHKAAKMIMEEYAGLLPETSKELLTIPGIGAYTAAAVASFAFNESVPLVDGNVLRVFTRLEQISDDISKTGTKECIRKKLQDLIPNDEPGAFNQGIMDLGRAICTPKNPDCIACPASSFCEAYANGNPEDFPVRAKKKSIPHYDIVIGLIRKEEEWLIQRRPAKGLLGGLWEFPGGKIEKGETQKVALLREIKEETSLEVNVAEYIGTIQHAYTHFKITLSAYYCNWLRGEPQTHAATENRWVNQEQLKKYALPGANLKILKLLGI